MVNAPPLFSVVIPAYNRADSILPTLMSVKQQTFGDFECIVVDDGSEDGPQLERTIGSLSDERFTYIRRQNGGGGAARNTGVLRARGKFIAFLDSDDLFLPQKLAIVASELADLEDPPVYYSQVKVDRGGKSFWLRPDRSIETLEDMGEYLFLHNQYIQTSSLVVPRGLMQLTKFDPNLRRGQDLDLCFRLHKSGAPFVMGKTPLSIWTDSSEVNRTSRYGSFEEPKRWLDNNLGDLTPRAAAGYRSTVLAYFMAKQHPFIAADYLVRGLLAGVPLNITVRQALRAFLPRATYRRIVNLVVDIGGRSKLGVK